MLELWGGHECTVNRIGDRYRDQTVLSGHQDRLADLGMWAGTGLRTLRYPALWERISPERPDHQDWWWMDERMAELRRVGVRPILGLVHHGSGPRYTGLLCDSFAPGLARHARAVAERYPWVRDWTPVNEPLTTARFSALYGHWYPHAQDEASFWRALLNQIDAVRLSMAAVRTVNPQARLIQTEDLGQTYGTPPLEQEVAFQNQRRWMSWDLLCGRVTPEHPLWPRLERFGLAARLEAIAGAPCPPDVLGVNFYVTSERFLDHRPELYPQWTVGEDGRFDMDALRVLEPGPVGLEGLLRQTWARYRRPIAVTESHLNGEPGEQMRWLLDAWAAALRLRAEGVDMVAVTSWALLGSFDWNSLLTREDGFYEPGAFDVSSGSPRATGIAEVIAHLARGDSVDDFVARRPELKDAGWWRRPSRLTLPPYHWQGGGDGSARR